MTLSEFKKKTLALIEEVNPNNKNLTDDPDIATKFNDVTNQVMFEMCRMKKIPKYIEFDVLEGDLIDFAKLEAEAGYQIYQVAVFGGVLNLPKANNTIYKILETGTAEVEVYVYPEAITEKTSGSYEFELTPDVLEVMPYGVAADLLKSDVSAEYGRVYAERYETMLQRLDPRNAMPSIYIDGGYNI